ncbi:S9 family peptidase [Roseateles koreensis]|uniref:Prolyl oligopeptidase family serine peptidase n=1 Tax=Roseateles koreensis TaxID=2987526 RepID=A0ABT5KPC8_9BURK|nr:prolyl oligopeptidase family serine peptidase [Roseateles koreensis]MDC8784772.1 prolyl oligopeptidase family serine peptidase [Roseateles koreensis]
MADQAFNKGFRATQGRGRLTATRLAAALLCAFALAAPAQSDWLAAPAAPPQAAAALGVQGGPVASQALSLERLFRAESYRGENAKELSFSRSGRYLAYLWNPFGEPGTDLYVYDTQTGKTQRLSSRALMTAFDAPEDLARFDRKLAQKRSELAERQAKEEAQAAYLQGQDVDLGQWEAAGIERVKKELAEKKARDDAQKAKDKADAEAEKAAMGALAAKRSGTPANAATPAAEIAAKDTVDKDKADKEKTLWELRDELKKSLAKNKLKPSDLYPGVAQFVWANKQDELILQYRGSLFRWVAGEARLQPLQGTQRDLRVLAYTPDDQGYVFMDDKRVLRASLRQGGVQVLNRELIHPDDAEKKYRIDSTVISENGRWMALVANAPLSGPDVDGKPGPAPTGRQVEIMDYSQRFAKAKKEEREVSDDKRIEKPLALYIRQVPAVGEAPRKQAAPVFTQAGGDGWFEMSPVAWARDGSHYVFSTWEREKELLRVYLGGADESAPPEVVLERRGDVGHEVVSVQKPQFTPDGKQLVLVLDDAGYRQPYSLDIASRALRPLLKGEFEAHEVLGFTSDSKTLFVAANKDDFGAMNVYRVNVADGRMQALGAAGDYHRGAVVSRDGQWAAANAGQWTARPELKLLKADRMGTADSATEGAKVLTDSHDKAWSQMDVLRPERFTFKNRHGDTLSAYAFKPAGWQATDRRPAVMYVYGGPLNDRHIVETDSFQPTAYVFGMYMAAKHGYVMVAVDTRGHSNYGRRFSDANWEQAGLAQAQDLEDAHRYLSEHLGVDPARVGLNGWSFGGFQTQYTMYSKPDLFAAGIAGAGPTEWENYNSWYTGRTIGKAERSQPNLRKYSLLPMARNLKKPLLLVHGMVDPNVLYQDTVNVYRALLESGKDALVDLYLDPDGEHAMGGAVKAAGWHRKYEAFWLRHLGQGKSNPAL